METKDTTFIGISGRNIYVPASTGWLFVNVSDGEAYKYPIVAWRIEENVEVAPGRQPRSPETVREKGVESLPFDCRFYTPEGFPVALGVSTDNTDGAVVSPEGLVFVTEFSTLGGAEFASIEGYVAAVGAETEKIKQYKAFLLKKAEEAKKAAESLV